MSKNIIAETLLNYNKTAIMELTQGNYDNALEIFKKSYFIENQMKFDKEKAKTLINIANTEMLLNKPEKALESSEEALLIFKDLRCYEDYLQTLLLIGKVSFFLKDTKKTQKVFNELIKKSKTDEMKAEAYYNLYDMYIEEKNNFKAQVSITKSIEYFEKSKKDEKLKLALQKRADFFKGLNRNDLAWMDLNKIKSLDNGMEL